MTAGSIAVPTIVPLRPPIPGKPKSSIDSNTKIELSTESNGARIYYTINGTKPDPFPKVSQTKYTMEYQGPFTLPAVKQTLKAVAVSADGMRESNVVTKVFEVDYVAQPALPPEGDDLEFRDDLEKEKTMPAVTTTALTCSKCRANNHPYATFCGSCGVKIEAPYRVDELNGFNREAQWLPVSTPLGAPPRPSNTIATQTVGLFYPSTRGMEKEKEKEEDKLAYERQMRDRRPLLTAVSPGKGYWRKQVEHVCQHIKAHAQNDAEFRALIGEPKMGKLLTSTVQEDGYELSLTVTFALRGGKDKFAGKKLGITGDYLSFHTEQDNMTTYRSDSDDYEEIIEDSPKKAGKKIIKKKKPVKRVSKQDQLLLKEVGPSGEGDPTEVQQLIDEGSDPNCVNKNNIPVLHIAAKNKWADCISVLVNGGADIDKKGPSTIKGNTALHEAVNVGPANGKVVEALLSNGANQNIKNDKGESPYDLAVKGGYENIVKKFAAALGQSQLNKMIRPKNKGY